MTSQTIQLPRLNDFNAWACFWYYDIGVNVIPTDAEYEISYFPFISPESHLFITKIRAGFGDSHDNEEE